MMNDLKTLSPASSSRRTKKSNRSNNFIEAIRDIGSSIKQQAKDATWGTGKTAVDQIFGTPGQSQKPQSGDLNAGRPFNFEDFLKSRERQIESITRQRYERRIREEKLVFYQKDEDVKLQIKSIQEELKKLAEAATGLSQEVKKAVFTGVAEAGVYHISFFDRIRRIIELARKQISESRCWFEAFNQRKKQKQGFYWFNVKKSGTKFMLSHERYMATQAG